MPGNPLSDPNWAADTADTVERVVGSVRDKAIRPIIYAARAVVFGLLGAFLGLFALIMAFILLFRGIQELLDLAVEQPRAVYLSYFIVGGLLCIVGLVLMRKRSPSTPS